MNRLFLKGNTHRNPHENVISIQDNGYALNLVDISSGFVLYNSLFFIYKILSVYDMSFIIKPFL